MTLRQRVVAALVVVAVGLAFADASVVALALPDLYAEFNTSIVGVSWVLTSYALVVAVVAVPIALVHRRVRPLSLVVGGVAFFAVSSVVAGFATSLTVLIVARCGQGVGATLLLAGSLPVLSAFAGDRAAALVGDGRRRRRRGRPGAGRRAHTAVRLAGDLLRAGPGRRRGARRRRRPGGPGAAPRRPRPRRGRDAAPGPRRRQRRVRPRVRRPRRSPVPRGTAGHRGVAIQPHSKCRAC